MANVDAQDEEAEEVPCLLLNCSRTMMVRVQIHQILSVDLHEETCSLRGSRCWVGARWVSASNTRRSHASYYKRDKHQTIVDSFFFFFDLPLFLDTACSRSLFVVEVARVVKSRESTDTDVRLQRVEKSEESTTYGKHRYERGMLCFGVCFPQKMLFL